MKKIKKPVKKVTTEELNSRSRKATAAAAAMLSGLIAITASGCSADIKLADGTPVGSVVINNEALSSNVSINQQGANADVITDPSIVLPEDNFDKETDPEKTDDTDPSEPENTEPEVVETTAAPTATPAPATATPTPKAAEPTKVPATPTAAPTDAPSEVATGDATEDGTSATNATTDATTAATTAATTGSTTTGGTTGGSTSSGTTSGSVSSATGKVATGDSTSVAILLGVLMLAGGAVVVARKRVTK